MEENFYYFTLDTPTTATAFLYGEIGWSVSAQAFVSELVRVEKLGVTDINVRIASYGGDVVEGFTIFTALQKSKARVTTFNDSVAASIAALIFLGGEKAVMADYATLMIHNPWTTGSDTKALEVLSLMRQSIITLMSKRTGLDAKKLGKLMDEESWFSAEEALELGFATAIEETGAMHQGESASGVNNLTHVKMYNSVLNKRKNKLAMNVENKAEAVITETHDTEITSAPEATTPEPAPEAETTETVTAPEPTITVEETAAAVLAPAPEPATTELVTIEEAKEKVEIQARLATLEATNERLRGENENILTVNQDLTAKLASMELALNSFKQADAEKAEALKMEKVNSLVEEAVKLGKIKNESRQSWLEIAKTSYQTAADALQDLQAPRVAPKAMTNILNASASATEKKQSLRDLEKTNPKEVERLYKEDRIAYNQMFFDCYGVQPS